MKPARPQVDTAGLERTLADFCQQRAVGWRPNPWFANDGCLLKQLLNYLQTSPPTITPKAEREWMCRSIRFALNSGFTLRTHLPGPTPELQREWLGERWIFTHEKCLDTTDRWTSIVSSRIGRMGRHLPQWPQIIAMALDSIRASGSTYLWVPRTTLAPLMRKLIGRVGLNYVTVDWADSQTRRAQWLRVLLENLQQPRIFRQLAASNEIHLGPSAAEAAPQMQRFPIQDRIAFCWGHSLRVLAVRPNGAIAGLLEQRLFEPRFTPGTCFLQLSDMPSKTRPSTSTALRSPRADRGDSKRWSAGDWLSRGGVGLWSVGYRYSGSHMNSRLSTGSPSATNVRIVDDCSRQPRDGCAAGIRWSSAPSASSQRSLFQWTCRISLCDCKDYLTHCIRGEFAALPPEETVRALYDTFAAGCLPEQEPMAKLLKILASGRLRARSTLLRTDTPCVSFSAVPLQELVGRRTFQPHLGRWDWESYGIRVDKQILQGLGARSVIYGNEATFKTMSTVDRPFFQPAMRRRTTEQRPDWEVECEWRFPGDVRLSALPPYSVQLFVEYETQAYALACQTNWPVIWLKDSLDAGPLGPRGLGRCKSIRTNRS